MGENSRRFRPIVLERKLLLNVRSTRLLRVSRSSSIPRSKPISEWREWISFRHFLADVALTCDHNALLNGTRVHQKVLNENTDSRTCTSSSIVNFRCTNDPLVYKPLDLILQALSGKHVNIRSVGRG
jgi:hypothetical protein